MKCDSRRARWIEAVCLDSGLTAEEELHLQSCETCSAVWERQQFEREVLRAMPSVPAPSELEGLVVAAFHGGHRQERAVARVRELPRKAVPDELEALVLSSLAPTSAGSEFEPDLVDRGAAGLGILFLRRLSRRSAPAVLEGCVERELGRQGRSPARRGLVVLFLLILLTGGLRFLPSVTSGEAAPAGATVDLASLPFEVNRVGGDRLMGTWSWSILDGYAGGALANLEADEADPSAEGER